MAQNSKLNDLYLLNDAAPLHASSREICYSIQRIFSKLYLHSRTGSLYLLYNMSSAHFNRVMRDHYQLLCIQN